MDVAQTTGGGDDLQLGERGGGFWYGRGMGRRRKTEPTGLLLVDKPAGLSSMDVVRQVRRAGRGVKTGHAGTLDPAATGLLICCLGRATKAVDRLMGLAKVYEACVDLSRFTTTDDAEGEPEPVAIETPPTEAAIAAACRSFEGQCEQVPPAHSAVRVGGQRAYALARQGEAVELPTRSVRIDRVEVRHIDWPRVDLRIACGKGTYIRSIARDLGRSLGTGGHLSALRRAAIGEYRVADAWSLDQLPDRLEAADLLPMP
jgi:tRNA pseudouridine55 synthase